jgi:hypothetical protein
VRVRIREADFTDPTAGLRAGLADVALTRTPFDRTGITTAGTGPLIRSFTRIAAVSYRSAAAAR